MGLIVLIVMGIFFLAIGLVMLGYAFIIKKILTSKLTQILRITLLILTLPLLIFPLYHLYSYYQNDMIYIRGFFGWAPKTFHSIEIDTKNGKLNFIIELDFNTGARGGAYIHNSLFYLNNGIKKEIVITQDGIGMGHNVYKEALKMKNIAPEIHTHQGYGNYYYDLYFSPKLFSIKEFEEISKFLEQNHVLFSKKINTYKENQKENIYDKTRFRNAYYQDLEGLNKTYECANNLQLYLAATGRLFYVTKDKISTSLNDIGDVKENGQKLILDKFIKVNQKNGTFQLLHGNTLIKDCSDNHGVKLFEEFQIEQSKQNLEIQ